MREREGGRIREREREKREREGEERMGEGEERREEGELATGEGLVQLYRLTQLTLQCTCMYCMYMYIMLTLYTCTYNTSCRQECHIRP